GTLLPFGNVPRATESWRPRSDETICVRDGDESRTGGEPVAGASGVRRTCEAESRGHCYQVGERVGFHLSHHTSAVCLDSDLANAELATDLLMQQAGDHQHHDLPFATAK